MPEPRHWHLILYDMSDDKARSKVHGMLVAWGHAVQYSVFRVRGTLREMERLQAELAKLFEPGDRLLVVRLCDGCAARAHLHGDAIEPWALDVPDAFIV